MARWADIRTRVQNAVGDITSTEAQAFALDAARELNAEARWYESLLSVGNTTAGTGEYDVADSIVDVYSVMVAGVPYVQATTRDIEEIDSGVSALIRTGTPSRGVFAAYYNTSGDLRLSLRPTPDESGVAITARVILPISVSNWSTEDPPWPADIDQVCINGGIALGLAEQDERLESAAFHRAEFDKGIRRLRTRKAGRVGKGAIQLSAPRRAR